MYQPKYSITNKITKALMQIEAVKENIKGLPITPEVLKSLRHTAHLQSTHFSTMIEGNRLTQKEVQEVIEENQRIPERERDEKEVLGYFTALDEIEKIALKKSIITENLIKKIHAVIMEGGRKKVVPTKYRDGQNVIKNSDDNSIVYMPPEAKDVPKLMKELVDWIIKSKQEEVASPIRAGIVHYQYATIHPYYDGNGRTARLLATLILHLEDYDLKGIYSLEEYYAQDLMGYYTALDLGETHNYYYGRNEADITLWIEYFCEGMAKSFEKVKKKALEAQGMDLTDKGTLLRELDARQRKVLDLFQTTKYVTTGDIANYLGLGERNTRKIVGNWVNEDFLIILDPSKKARKYQLAMRYRKLFRV